MAVSGAVLREVGTTNITRLADYERAIGPNTAALMQVHTSNYRVSGFTEVGAAGRAGRPWASKHSLPVIDDIGSGALLDFGRFGFRGEPVARRQHRGRGRPGAVQRRQAAGRAAGRHHRRPQGADPEDREGPADAGLPPRQDDAGRPGSDAAALPRTRSGPCARCRSCACWATPLAELRQRAEALAVRLREIDGRGRGRVADDVAYVGGGSLPDQTLPTCGGGGRRPRGLSDAELAYRLRTGEPGGAGPAARRQAGPRRADGVRRARRRPDRGGEGDLSRGD